MTDTGILGYPSVWATKKNVAIRLPGTYAFPGQDMGPRIYRRKVIMDVGTTMPVTEQTGIIRFQIPSSGATLYDFSRGSIHITFSVSSATVGANPCPSNLAWNIIDRFTIDQGANRVLDQNYFNYQETLYYTLLCMFGQRMTTGVNMWGEGNIGIRKARAGGWKYQLPIGSNCLTKSILPWFKMMAMGNVYQPAPLQDIFLEWTLAKPEAFIETDIATSDLHYSISRVEVEYEELLITNLASFMSQWNTFKTWGLRYPPIAFRTTTTYNYTLSTAAEQDIQLDIQYNSIICIVCTFQYVNQIYNSTVRDKFENFLGQADLPFREYQWMINTKLWPDKPVDMSDPDWSHAYKVYLNTFHKYHGRGAYEDTTPLLPGEFITNKFVLCLDAQQFPFYPSLINPVSTILGNGQVHLMLKFNSVIPAGIRMLAHVMHWKWWNLGATGDTPVTEK